MLGMASQQRGYLYSQAGRYNEAIRDLSVAIEIRPGYRGNYMNRAAAYKKLGRLKLAQTDIEMYNKLPELEKNAVTGWSARAMRPPVHAR
jgi:tetratricopeptide (TPR) repeat protein